VNNGACSLSFSKIRFRNFVYAVEDLATWLYDAAKGDLPSYQMSLVRFRAQPFHTMWHQPSQDIITGEVPINVVDSPFTQLVIG